MNCEKLEKGLVRFYTLVDTTVARKKILDEMGGKHSRYFIIKWIFS